MRVRVQEFARPKHAWSYLLHCGYGWQYLQICMSLIALRQPLEGVLRGWPVPGVPSPRNARASEARRKVSASTTDCICVERFCSNTHSCWQLPPVARRPHENLHGEDACSLRATQGGNLGNLRSTDRPSLYISKCGGPPSYSAMAPSLMIALQRFLSCAAPRKCCGSLFPPMSRP